jgi:hypothetical protein
VENTVVIFTGDNGTARFGVKIATVDGKPISGNKGSMLEGGSRVPLAINWPGHTPAGKVNNDLTDFSDFFPTFVDLAGAKLPEGVKIDGQSFAPQIEGKKGTPREWVYVELTAAGEMFDLSEAPFKEIPVAKDSKDSDVTASRKALQSVLDEHKAIPGHSIDKEQKKKNKAAQKKRLLRRQAAEKQRNGCDPNPPTRRWRPRTRLLFRKELDAACPAERGDGFPERYSRRRAHDLLRIVARLRNGWVDDQSHGSMSFWNFLWGPASPQTPASLCKYQLAPALAMATFTRVGIFSSGYDTRRSSSAEPKFDTYPATRLRPLA